MDIRKTLRKWAAYQQTVRVLGSLLAEAVLAAGDEE